jgi:hypothetical protein
LRSSITWKGRCSSNSCVEEQGFSKDKSNISMEAIVVMKVIAMMTMKLTNVFQLATLVAIVWIFQITLTGRL